MRVGKRFKSWQVVLAILGGLGLLVAAVLTVSMKGGGDKTGVTYVLRSRSLRVTTTTKSGDLRTRDSVDILCELEGSATISWLIPEGTWAKKGDLLVELDPGRGAEGGSLEERRTQEQITVANAQAAYYQAREAFEIQKSRNESNVTAAQLKEKFAEMDMDKYLGDEDLQDGQWHQEKRQAEAAVMLAREELERATDRYNWTKQLYEKGYVTGSDLQADELAVKRAEVKLESEQAQLKLLQKYDHPKQLEQLKSNYQEAGADLKRVERQADAQLTQAKTQMEAKNRALELQEARLAKVEDQLKKIKIYAPQHGLAMYAPPHRRWDEPLDTGSAVRLNEKLIVLPDTSTYVADARVQEVDMHKVKLGQQAYVNFDARPGLTIKGKVTRISSFPDRNQSWYSQMKEYAVEITLEEEHNEALQLGLSAQVEIVVAELTDVLSVPLQAVSMVDGKPVCYVDAGGGHFLPRRVVLGLSSNEAVEIKSGLKEGDVILLYAPEARGEGLGLKALSTTESTEPESSKPVPSEKASAPQQPEEPKPPLPDSSTEAPKERPTPPPRGRQTR